MNKKLVLTATMILGAAAGLLLWRSASTAPENATKPGGAMKMEHQQSQPAAKSEPKILYYVDSMHPWYKSDKPGFAPDCGMELTPVYAEEGGAESPGTVVVSGHKQQLINLKIVEAKEMPISNSIRTVGTLQYDETGIARIHSKIEGWIDRVFVDYTGQYVKKGQPLFSIYSPELVATQQEYLLALKADRSLSDSEFADVSSGAKSLRASALQRLKLWDVSDNQIRKLEETGAPMTSITFFSPVSGFVTEKNVFEKQRITYDTETYAIADLSRIWLMADVYEYEAARVKLGQKAIMTLAYGSAGTYDGSITYIYPSLNDSTRTLKVRVEFPNPGFALKPGMYANVELVAEQGTGIVIPEDAVLDSGTRQMVFVRKSDTEFEPREVRTGAHLDGNVVILSGLTAGEKVVGAGNFLIDSESQLKAALEGMSPSGHQHGQ